jgi:Raf kinase inhibitor-like YbhB/YbcL family protein
MARRSIIIAAVLLSLLPVLSLAQTKKAAKFSISSLVFKPGEFIPVDYTCEGRNVNPPLGFSTTPPKTKSLALIMEDPDVPSGVWVHWIVYNIHPVRWIPEDNLPGQPGKTDSNEKGIYSGPCPPAGVHRYHFKAYALDTELEFKSRPTKEELEMAMQGHILDRCEMIGLYKKGSQ